MDSALKNVVISSEYKSLQQYTLYKLSDGLECLCKSVYDSVVNSIELKVSGLRVMSTEIYDAHNKRDLCRILHFMKAYCPDENMYIVDTSENKMQKISVYGADYIITNDIKAGLKIVCATILGQPEAKGVNEDNASLLLYFLTIYTLSPKEQMTLKSSNIKEIDTFLGGIA